VSQSEAQRLTNLLLADIVAISADAVICVDTNHTITLFNDGASAIFGWTADEVMGKPLDMLLPERFRGLHGGHVDVFRKSKDNARRMGERREISGQRKNGQEFPAEAAIAKVHKGDTVVFSVVLRDITEQVELHKRLQRAVVARDEMVAVVAHDLRNPLSAIKMLVHSAIGSARTGGAPQTLAENLDLIRSAAEQMDLLIQDLLDVTRLEVGQLRIDPKPVALSELLDQSLTTLKPLVENAMLTLSVGTVSGAVRVLADAPRVAQVLSNLIGNAIKFTASGGRVSVAVSNEGAFARIAVSDTGTGIAREQLVNVFDRFWQTQQPSIRVRGAGLGLAIARGVVKAHGGEIWAESELGKGSTFYFTLPLEASS
jgi:PAS domain S-box-containing protein